MDFTLGDVEAVYVDPVEVDRVRSGWPVPRLIGLPPVERYAVVLALVDAGIPRSTVAAAVRVSGQEAKKIVEWRRRITAKSLEVAS